MSDKAVSRILHEAERELDAAKRETCSPAVDRLIDCVEKIIEILQMGRDRSLMDSYADLKAQKDAMLARESDTRQKEIDEAVAGAYRAAAGRCRVERLRLENIAEQAVGPAAHQLRVRAATLHKVEQQIEADTPTSAEKAFMDAVAAGVATERLRLAQVPLTPYGESLQQQLTRLTEEKERLAKALPTLEAIVARQLVNAEDNVKSAEGEHKLMPFDHDNNDALDEHRKWLADVQEAMDVLAALTPAAGGETRGNG